MAIIVTPLSPTKVLAAKPKERLYKLSDGGGLALWVSPNGRKTWRFEYRREDKKLDTITIGPFPEVSLAEARLFRVEYRGLLANGGDPKAKQKSEPTFAEVAEMWLERMKSDVTSNYYEKLVNALRKNVPPKFSSMIMSEIKPPDVVKILTVIEKRGALEQLNRVRQNLKVIWEFAISRGVCELNPVASIGMNAFKKHKATNYKALAPHQIPLLLEKLDMGYCTGITRFCLYFQLYSLSRPSEATNALKSEIDLEAKQWIQSAEKMKMRKDHVVPLSNQMMALIIELVELDLPGPYPSRLRASISLKNYASANKPERLTV